MSSFSFYLLFNFPYLLPDTFFFFEFNNQISLFFACLWAAADRLRPSCAMPLTRDIVKEGSGPQPCAGDSVTVLAVGLFPDGKVFWPTEGDPQPFSFRVGLGHVIRGWDEGVLQMSVGEKAKLTMTSDYAYGEKGFPLWGILPGASLVFEIELLKID
uniref:peptidylprolyl isomerase n=1 Tax=Trypanosoma congolense (strain IL3000) TaxID=1068625 RepID=G0UW54_TRYCI|nr:putative peptidyl-prolyl cis-trans isomerase [Trypanosoma congolense IL3000]